MGDDDGRLKTNVNDSFLIKRPGSADSLMDCGPGNAKTLVHS